MFDAQVPQVLQETIEVDQIIPRAHKSERVAERIIGVSVSVT